MSKEQNFTNPVSKVFYSCVDYNNRWEAALLANLTYLLHGFSNE
jgi:hypothetical protein